MDSPMKICVVSTPVFRVPCAGYAGLEVIAWETARGLATLGHQVALVAPDGSECPGVEMIYNGPEKTWDEKTAYSKYWHHLPNFDVVVDSSWNKWSYILKREGKLPAPILGVMHAPVNTMYGSLPPDIDKPCFVCISQDQANHFEAIHGREAKVCYNGIDLKYYRPMNVPRTERFLFLARFSSIKAPHLAIEACKKAGVGLDLVGDTSITNEPDYLKYCESLADGNQIRIVGPASRGETVWWFSQAKALLHPTQNFREPFGLAPVEAMACGCPVVAWNYGALKETVGSGCGVLVKSVDDMVKAIIDIKNTPDEQMRAIRQVCVENARRFSIENMTKRYEELCIDAVTNGGW